MVAKFLHFFPQYRLEDLADMSYGEFSWLYGGMLDVESPELTEPFEDVVQRTLREKVAAAARRR